MRSPASISRCSIPGCYAVLAPLSGRYPPLEGRSPTRYSPVCHSTQGLLPFRVRLACVRHAASVDSEPGSNSHVKFAALPSPSRDRLGQTPRRESLSAPYCVVGCLAQRAPSGSLRNRARPADTRRVVRAFYLVFKEPAASPDAVPRSSGEPSNTMIRRPARQPLSSPSANAMFSGDARPIVGEPGRFGWGSDWREPVRRPRPQKSPGQRRSVEDPVAGADL